MVEPGKFITTVEVEQVPAHLRTLECFNDDIDGESVIWIRQEDGNQFSAYELATNDDDD